MYQPEVSGNPSFVITNIDDPSGVTTIHCGYCGNDFPFSLGTFSGVEIYSSFECPGCGLCGPVHD